MKRTIVDWFTGCDRRRWTRHLRIRWQFMAVIGVAALSGWWLCIRMPGVSAPGPLPPMAPEERAIESDLRAWLNEIAGDIGRRSATPEDADALARASELLQNELRAMGYEPSVEGYDAGALRVSNLVAEVPGREPSAGIVLVGAHYDTYPGSRGANDNGSGVATLLHLAERFANASPRRTIRFVLFTNEEPPHFRTSSMGSLVYAEDCRVRGDRIHAMWSLETLAYYSDEPGTQRYPAPLLGLIYPDRGDFVAFVGDLGARALVRDTIGRFRRRSSVPSEGAALPGWVAGVGWSDHWSFARVGYPALMITDTAVFRDPAYHTVNDRPGRLDLGVLARVAAALGDVLAEVAEVEPR